MQLSLATMKTITAWDQFFPKRISGELNSTLPPKMKRFLPDHNIPGSHARSLFSKPVYERKSKEKFQLFTN